MRTRIWHGYKHPDYRVYDLPCNGSFVSPSDDSVRRMPCTTPGEMKKVSRLQVEKFADVDPVSTVGGSLIIARVSEAGIQIQQRCELTNEKTRTPVAPERASAPNQGRVIRLGQCDVNASPIPGRCPDYRGRRTVSSCALHTAFKRSPRE